MGFNEKIRYFMNYLTEHEHFLKAFIEYLGSAPCSDNFKMHFWVNHLCVVIV